MSENNEEILANFQSITAIEDVGEAIYHLEESNWDLYAAVHRVLPPDNEQHGFAGFNGAANRNNVMIEELNDLDVGSNVDELMTAPSSPARATYRNIYGPDMSADTAVASVAPIDLIADYNGSSSSGSSSNHAANMRHKVKDVLFNIHYKYQIHKITISNQATVGELKAKIMDVTSIPVCRQALKGWLPLEQACTNSTVLHTLNIACENELILTDLSEEGFTDDDMANRHTDTFSLNIKRLPEGTDIPLNFPGHQRLIDIKTDVYAITDIPVRHQEWTGWPTNMTNNTTLAQSGIDLVHTLFLRSSSPTSNLLNRLSVPNANATTSTESSSARSSVSNVIEILDSDESEFEDATDADFNADEELFAEPVSRNRLNHLIADDIDDEKVGSIQFVENYVQRYGVPHPEFFVGNLEEALNEACHKPAKDRKLLAIYLHHDGSVLTNVFCDQLLKCDSIMQTLHHNFILFGWDFTYESNKNMFLSSISACVGMTATISARNILVGQLPTILVIGKSRSTCEVLSIIHGNVGRDELLNKLIDTINMYSDQRDIEVREENDRWARQQVKLEQDVAYNESLEADRRKEEAKRQKEHALATERKRLESERQEIEAVREANRLEAERCVPPEPPIGTEGITKIRIRIPTGIFFERRFTVQSKLLVLLKFIASKGFPTEEFKVISSFPRRDLTTMNVNETLGHYKLCPQETVILEER